MSKSKRKLPSKNSGLLTGTQYVAMLPDSDPWRRVRRRLLGLDPDEE